MCTRGGIEMKPMRSRRPWVWPVALTALLFMVGQAAAEPVKIYWTDEAVNNHIARSNPEGTGFEVLVTIFPAGHDNSPTGIALDTAGGKMYWADIETDKIQRANLNGSGIEDVTTAVTDPDALALDVAGGKMYWTVSSLAKIQRADLDGSGIEDIRARRGRANSADDFIARHSRSSGSRSRVAGRCHADASIAASRSEAGLARHGRT